jgi:hypothetical protein
MKDPFLKHFLGLKTLCTLTYLINEQPCLLIFGLLPPLLVYFYVIKAFFSCNKKKIRPSILAYSILCVY